MSTEWRPVTGWEGLYEVSDQGEVFSLPRWAGNRADPGQMLALSRAGRYLVVSLKCRDRQRSTRVHKLVAEAFIGPCPPGQEVRHWNGNPLDNRATNLLYGTTSDNRQDSIRLGTIARGEGSGSAKLTAAQVHEIRQRYAAGGVPQHLLAAEYGVGQMTISRLIRGETWGHIPGGAS